MVTDWPCDIGGADPAQYFPATDLFAIIKRANLYAGVDRKLVIATACDCARDHETQEAGTSWPDATTHCEWIRLAHKCAQDGKWPECVEALLHQDGPPVSAPTGASAQPWTCDVAPAIGDPDEHLFATIERANTAAPDADAKVVVAKACACSEHPATMAGSKWATIEAHVQWTVEARTEAAASNWSACIDALEHVGGGGDDEDVEPGKESEDAPTIERAVFDFVAWLQKSKRYEAIRKKLPIKSLTGPKKKKKSKKKKKKARKKKKSS